MIDRKPLVLAIAAITVSVAVPRLALSGGYALNEQGAHASGTANAGAAANPENASILFFNPAGMTELEGTQISFGAALLEVDPKFSGTATNTIGQPVAGGNGGDFVDSAVIPNLYLTHTVDNFSAGIGIYAPFGLKGNYEDDFRGRFFADRTEIEALSVQPSFAFKLNDQLSLGFGMNVMRAEGKLTKFQDYSGLTLPPTSIPQAFLREGYFDVEGDDWDYGWNAGILFKPAESTNVGLSYRSEAKFLLKGDASLTNVPTGNPAAPFTTLTEKAEVPLTTPESATLSVKQDVTDQWSLLFGTTWTRWSRFDALEIWTRQGGGGISALGSAKYGSPGLIGYVPERWGNTWSASIGTAYRLTPNWMVKAGYAFDESPAPKQYRTARVPSSDRHWLTLGAQWRESENGWRVDAAFGYLLIDDVEVNEYEYTIAGPPVTGLQNLRAEYEIDAWGAALQVSKGF